MTSTPSSTPTPASAPPRRNQATDVALVAGFAALVAVCAILPAIKVGAGLVPITLQTFAVLLAGAVLGPVRGFLAVALYVVVGAAGLPVFSGGAAGLGVLAGPTAGYLLGFPLAAGLCGLIVSRLPRRGLSSVPLVFAAGLVSSAVFIHTLGMAGLVLRADLTWGEAFDVDKVFWIGDAIKNLAMALVATAVHRAFPDLLGRRAPAHETAPAAAASTAGSAS